MEQKPSIFEQLKDHLTHRREKFIIRREVIVGMACSTCGPDYEWIDEVAFDRLLDQIDEFSQQFRQ